MTSRPRKSRPNGSADLAKNGDARGGRQVTARVAPSWVPQALDPDLPPYLALLQALERDVASGALPAGARLPPHRVLATHLGWSLSTVTKAYREATVRGTVAGHVGQGTFVARRDPSERTFRTDSFVHLEVNRSPEVGQQEALRSAMAQVTRNANLDRLFAYDARQGLAEHREALAEWISTPDFRPTPDYLLATNGAQHGLDLALSIACKRGATILTEELTYVGFRALANLNDYDLVPVAIDGEGLVPDALEERLRATGASIVYAMPTLHSPTGRTMSPERRRKIAAIINRYNALLIEDDVYGFLPDPKPDPIAGLIPEQTIYLASLSKVFDLGFRAGAMVVPPSLLDSAQIAMRASAWSATPLLFELGDNLIRSGTLDVIVKRLRAEIRRRVDMFQRIFPEQILPHEGKLCGYHVWLELPNGLTAEDLRYKARNEGVLITPPGSSSIQGMMEPGIRLCLGAAGSEAELERGMRVLRQIMERPDQSFFGVV